MVRKLTLKESLILTFLVGVGFMIAPVFTRSMLHFLIGAVLIGASLLVIGLGLALKLVMKLFGVDIRISR